MLKNLVNCRLLQFYLKATNNSTKLKICKPFFPFTLARDMIFIKSYSIESKFCIYKQPENILFQCLQACMCTFQPKDTLQDEAVRGLILQSAGLCLNPETYLEPTFSEHL